MVKKKKISIVHIQLLSIFSGVQKAMYGVLVRLDREKYDINVLCQSEGELTESLKKKNIKYIILPELRREINPYYDSLAFLKLYKMFKKARYDIVHTHSSKPGLLGRFAAKAAGIDCIVHTVQGFAFHQFSFKWKDVIYQFLERLVGLVADKIIIVNSDDYKFAKKRKLARRNKLVKIYNGIPLNNNNYIINVQKKKELLNIPEDYQVVGSVGRLWKQKAPQIFIKAIPIVLKQMPNTIFLVVGDGPLRNDLENLVQQLLIQDKVIFFGWRKDVSEILKVLDVFVQTSLWEGLSLSIMEAMAAGKPVVATNIKGNNELVLDGVSGYLVQPNNPEELANRIVTILNNKKLAKEMGKRGSERIKKEFNISTNVKKIERIYNELLTNYNSSVIV